MRPGRSAVLSHKRAAVTGGVPSASNHGSNVVYQRMRERGYEVVAGNPDAETVEGYPAYPDLRSIPGGVDAVVIAAAPQHGMSTMQEAVGMGIAQVWMHRSFGGGSVEDSRPSTSASRA